jgi:hypothetical protein
VKFFFWGFINPTLKFFGALGEVVSCLRNLPFTFWEKFDPSPEDAFEQLLLVMPETIWIFEPPLEECNTIHGNTPLDVHFEHLGLYIFRHQHYFAHHANCESIANLLGVLHYLAGQLVPVGS